ncbi:barstar family protein [Promicromonospora sp. NPDC050880]|uniref:barstar family protein n=1 Tax=unclassified Promicromonospora TaxID=2647929 RepID=UPI0037ADAD6B
MAEIRIEGRSVTTESDVHRVLAEQLDLGPWYGRNLAALHDRLSTDVDRPLRIIWLDSATSRSRLGADLFDDIVAVLRDVARQDLDLGWVERFEFELR